MQLNRTVRSRLNRSGIVSLLLLAALIWVGVLQPSTPAYAVSTTVVISQFQVAGGTAADEFVELHNVSNSPVDLNGHRLVYRSAAGTSDGTIVTWTSSTIIPAGGFYLIGHAASYDGTATADATYNTGSTGTFAAAGGGLALRNGAVNEGTIVDSVGYGSATNAFVETAVTSAPAANQSKARLNNGCTDTDNNNNDFETLTTSAPRNSATTPVACGGGGGTPTSTATIDPEATATSTATETPTPTATATATNTPVPQCGASATLISEIQGTTDTNTANGQNRTIEALVVGDLQRSTGMNGFFVQEETADWDANAATSEGLFVYVPSANSAWYNFEVAAGDLVRVTGRLTEFQGLTEMDNVTSIEICTPGFGMPALTVVELPETTNGELEQYEGMYITISDTLTVAQNFFQGRYGQVTLSSNGRLYQPTNLFPAGSPEAQALAAENARNIIVLDDARSAQNPNPIPYIGEDNTLRAGDVITGGVTGLLDFGPINSDTNIRDYRIQPSVSPVIARVNERPTEPEEVGGTVRVASFNVLNYFNGDGLGGGFPTSRGANTAAEFQRQRAKIINAIIGLDADVVGLLEIENDAPGSTSAIQDLVNGLNAATAPGTYAVIADPATGVGDDEIKVALIYRPAAVTPMGASLSDPDEIHDRPPVAQTFAANGQVFSVVVNHFKSKGSCPSSSADPNADQGDGQGCWNLRRIDQANALLTFIDNEVIPAAGDSDVLIIGDLNSYGEEDPILTLENNGFVDEIERLIGGTAYSYVFDGLSGYLDHALASDSLSSQVTGVTEWHINADEPSVIDYNTEFKPQDFYQPDAYRSSDHDPVLVGLNLVPAALTVDKNAPTDVRSNDVLTYTISFGSTGGAANGVTLSDTLPAATTFVSGSLRTDGSAVDAAYDSATNRVEFGPVTLAPNGMVTVTYAVMVTASSGTITNTAELSATNAASAVYDSAATTLFVPPTSPTIEEIPNDYDANVVTSGESLNITTDDGVAAITMPFAISFYGQPTTQLRVSNNGVIGVGATGAAYGDNLSMAAAPDNTIAPFWDNLGVGTAGSGVYSYTIGLDSAPDQVFILGWNELPHADYPAEGTVTFQVKFFEVDSHIEFHYLDTVFRADADAPPLPVDEGGSATVGIKGSGAIGLLAAPTVIQGGSTSGPYTQYSFNQPVVGNAGVSLDPIPAAVEIAGFNASFVKSDVVLNWETTSERNNVGFNLLRGTSSEAPDRQVNDTLIPSQGPSSNQGFSYQWIDSDLESGATYYYWLEAVDTQGNATRVGPASVTVNVPTAVTIGTMGATPLPTYNGLVAALMLLAATGVVLVWQRRR